jgi:hypothetical protein
MLLGGDRLGGGERCGIRSSSQTQFSFYRWVQISPGGRDSVCDVFPVWHGGLVLGNRLFYMVYRSCWHK